MGWFDSFTGGSKQPPPSDPVQRLDPKLREFLERESSTKHRDDAPNTASSSTRPIPRPTSTATASTATAAAAAAAAAVRPSDEAAPPPAAAPAESLYQDGRYAHLWRTYRPAAVVEEESKTEHEKMTDALGLFTDRKGRIGKAALENCAMEQVAWRRCVQSDGSWLEQNTGCVEMQKRFQRCYDMNTRLLKVLGYLSTVDRTPEDEERIQMHADKLWQRQQALEDAEEQARREGRPVPAARSIFADSAAAAQSSAQQSTSKSTTPRPRESQPDAGDDDAAALAAATAGQRPPSDPLFATPEFADAWRARLEKLGQTPAAANANAVKTTTTTNAAPATESAGAAGSAREHMDRQAEEAAFRAEWVAQAEAASRLEVYKEGKKARSGKPDGVGKVEGAGAGGIADWVGAWLGR